MSATAGFRGFVGDVGDLLIRLLDVLCGSERGSKCCQGVVDFQKLFLSLLEEQAVAELTSNGRSFNVCNRLIIQVGRMECRSRCKQSAFGPIVQ